MKSHLFLVFVSLSLFVSKQSLAGTCCCLVDLKTERVDPNTHDLDRKKYQTTFVIEGQLKLIESQNESGMCQFEWNERTDEAFGLSDIIVNTWQDHVQLRPVAYFEGSGFMWEEWNQILKEFESGNLGFFNFKVVDLIYLKYFWGEIKRKLEINPVLKSGCPNFCSKQEKSVYLIQDWHIDGDGTPLKSDVTMGLGRLK